MASLNRVQLIGRLGRDPEARTLQNGGRVVNLSIATSETWKDKSSGEKKEKTEWHRCVIFNDRLAKFAESYATKGALVYFEGQMQTRKYQDGNGVEKYATEVVAQQFNGEFKILADSKPDPRGVHPSDPDARAPASRDDPLDDEIPF